MSDESKLAALNATLDTEKFHRDKEGKFFASFGIMRGNAVKKLNTLGLQEGVDFHIGDPRAGEIIVNPKALPDPDLARDGDFVLSRDEAQRRSQALGEMLGAPTRTITKYTGNPNKPLTQTILAETDNSLKASDLLKVLTELRRDARIPEAELRIQSFGEDRNLRFDPEQLTPERLDRLRQALDHTDLDNPGLTYRQRIAALAPRSETTPTRPSPAQPQPIEKGLIEQIKAWQQTHRYVPSADWGDFSTPSISKENLQGINFFDGNYTLPATLKTAIVRYGSDSINEAKKDGIDLAKTVEFKQADIDGSGTVSAEEIGAIILARQMQTTIKTFPSAITVRSQIDFTDLSEARMANPAISGGSAASSLDKAALIAHEIYGDNFNPQLYGGAQAAGHDEIYRAQLASQPTASGKVQGPKR